MLDVASSNPGPLEILIADDQKTVRESLCQILQLAGYRVGTADGGMTAISFLQSHAVPLLLLDLNMESCNGYQVLEFIAEHNITTNVVIISGEANFNDARRALRYEFVRDFIKKPYEVRELLSLIASTIKVIALASEKKVIQERLKKSERMYRFVVEKSPDILYIQNKNGEFSFLNTVVEEKLGYSLLEIQNCHFSQLVYKDDLIKAAEFFNMDDTQLGVTQTIELRLTGKNAKATRYVEITAVAIDLNAMNLLSYEPANNSQQPGFYGVIRDIHERKLAENNLSKLNLAMENSPNLIFITDNSGIIEYVNHKILQTTGYLPQEVMGQNPRIFSSGETSGDDYQELWNTISSGKVWRGALKNRKKNGEIYWAQESIAPMIDSEGNITNYVVILEDVTESLLHKEELSYQATHDALTHLINRHEFDRRLERVMTTAQDPDSHHALCYMDLDQFKIVNDTCSHTAGDELLRQVSYQLSQIIRRRDTLARLGGDEFAILMEHCSLEQAQHTTQRIHQMIEQFHFHWEDKSFRIGVSIGLVIINSTNCSASVCMRQADMACYMAKEAGRNRTHIYRDDDKKIIQHDSESSWLAKINRAFQEDLFELYTQAIIPMNDQNGQVGECCEVLVRISDQQGSASAAGSFLPAAERYHLSPKIDRWVIQKVFNNFSQNQRRLSNLVFCAVNLSALSINDAEFPDYIENQLVLTGMPAHKICFEMSEAIAIANLSTVTEFITRMKKQGFLFALDNFGGGLSSFAYLKSLPVDFIKIDGFFVKDIEHDPIDYAMVKSINDISKVMGKRTIAEFVENKEILAALEELKIDFVQGFHISHPKPIDWGQ
ncbi:MAG: two-component system response regulator [Methylobacter sp.]|nr:MAG: two-component system response regulator [Methylobacter sp.]PPD37462.1 MAG: two-component system response regulator [Methylomonas sp.]